MTLEKRTKILTRILSLLFKPIKDGGRLRIIVSCVLKAIGEKTSTYITYSEKPVNVDVATNELISIEDLPTFALVIQGPIDKKDNFTYETVRYYKRFFPTAHIIVSTWLNEEKGIIDKIKKEGVEVIQTQLPEHSGIYNVNYQSKSTKVGLERAKLLGYKYSIKSRSDQRIYRADIIPYLFGLLEEYPLDNDAGVPQKRIVFCGGNHSANLLIPYHICDFFFFGTTEDLLRYFDYDSVDDWGKDGLLESYQLAEESNMTVAEYNIKFAPESILMKNYLNKSEIKYEANSMEEYWKLTTSYFVPVSIDDLSLYWSKQVSWGNDSFFKNEYKTFYDTKLYSYVWSFRNWLLIKNGKFLMSDKIKSYSQQCYKANL